MIFKPMIAGFGILDFFQWFIDIWSSMWNLVCNLFSGLIQLIKLLPVAVNMLTVSIGILPSLLVGFAGVTITVCVIFILVGRNAGGKN